MRNRNKNIRQIIRSILSEGTWSIPKNDTDIDKVKYALQDLRDSVIDISTFKERIYDVLGDDELFDALDNAEEKENEEGTQYFFIFSTVQSYLVKILKDFKDNPNSFKNPSEFNQAGVEDLTKWIEGQI